MASTVTDVIANCEIIKTVPAKRGVGGDDDGKNVKTSFSLFTILRPCDILLLLEFDRIKMTEGIITLSSLRRNDERRTISEDYSFEQNDNGRREKYRKYDHIV